MNLAKSFASALVLCLVGIAVTFYVPACHTPPPTTPESGPSVGTKLKAQAEHFLGKVAAAELTALADGSLAKDPLHAAAAAAWSAVTPKDLENGINAATNNAAPGLASSAALLVMQYAREGKVSKEDAINAVASALSATAFGSR